MADVAQPSSYASLEVGELISDKRFVTSQRQSKWSHRLKSRDLVFGRESTTIASALELMGKENILSLPVLDNDQYLTGKSMAYFLLSVLELIEVERGCDGV